MVVLVDEALLYVKVVLRMFMGMFIERSGIVW